MQSSKYAINSRGQYRSAIFCVDDEQLKEATASRDGLQSELEARGLNGMKVSTEIAPLTTFWRAEEYHQQYYAKKMGPAACATPTPRIIR